MHFRWSVVPEIVYFPFSFLNFVVWLYFHRSDMRRLARSPHVAVIPPQSENDGMEIESWKYISPEDVRSK